MKGGHLYQNASPYIPASIMKVQLDATTQATLDERRTMRCVCRATYSKPSRDRDDVIEWAKTIVNKFVKALAAHLKQPITAIDTQLNCVVLTKRWAGICYDLFLEDCDAALRAEIDSSTSRPIHFVEKRGHVCHAQRRPRLDAFVATTYANLRIEAPGFRPYFGDLEDPPVDEDGQRVAEFAD